MSDDLLRKIDDYVADQFAPVDSTLETALKDAAEAGLPEIHVSASEGKLLYLLVKMVNARRILEIGTLGGYSTIWLARALPENGKLISLELSDKHAEVARKNIQRAGLSEKVEIRVGPATNSLDQILRMEESPFDVAFIDADKASYPQYLERCMKLLRPGGLILGDNCLRRVTHEIADNPDSRGIQQFNETLAGDPRLESIVVPIIRHKIDGLAIARVK